MAFKYTIEQSGRLMIVTLSGVVTATDLIEVFSHITRLSPSTPLDMLWDGREIEGLVVPPDSIGQLHEAVVRAEAYSGGGRGAWVVKESLGNSDMIASLLVARLRGGERQRRSFTSYDEALAWLTEKPFAHPFQPPSVTLSLEP